MLDRVIPLPDNMHKKEVNKIEARWNRILIKYFMINETYGYRSGVCVGCRDEDF